MNTTGPVTAVPILLMRVRNQCYALRLDVVEEVAALVALETVTEGPSALRGLANRHGLPLPVFDLGLLLGQGPLPPALDQVFVVCHWSSRDMPLIGIIVDEVKQVMNVPQSALVRLVRATDALTEGVNISGLAAPVPLLDLAVLVPELRLKLVTHNRTLAALRLRSDDAIGPGVSPI